MDPIDDLLADLLVRPDSQWRSALDELCREHPPLAEELKHRFALLEGCGIADPTEPLPHAGAPTAMPERFGPYRLLRPLGGGGMGVVWLALHETLGREVAVKMIRPEQFWLDSARDRFRREIEAIARLRHPGCVQIHQVGEAGGVPYFAMEFVPGANCEQILAALRSDPRTAEPARLSGADLATALRQRGAQVESGTNELFHGPWPRVAIAIVLAAAEALAHAHARGVIHRDLKPSNLMVTPAGRVIVVDFGLAAAAGSSPLTRDGSQLGSVPYMAPEQLRGEGAAIGEHTDVYALGVCLYELLALRPPFAANREHALRQDILAGDCEPVRAHNPAVGRDLALVVAKAMHVEPARRYRSANEFAADLVAVLGNRPIRARREGPLARATRWARRHPAWATATALVLLTLVVLPTAISLAIAGQRSRAVAAEQLARRREYAASIGAAAVALRAGNGAEARLRLDACADDLRGFEWRHLALALDSSTLAYEVAGPVTAVAATPDGARAAAGTQDGGVALFGLLGAATRVDLRPPGGPAIVALTFAADGAELLVLDAEYALRVFGVADGRLHRERPRARGNERLCLPRSADCIVCDSGDGRLSLLDPQTLAVRREFALAPGEWASEARWVVVDDEATAGGRHGISCWNLSDGARRPGWQGPAIELFGARPPLFAGRIGGAIAVVDRDRGTQQLLDTGRRRPTGVLLLRDGRQVVAPCDTGEVLVFDVTAGVLLRTLLGHRGRVQAAAAIGDGPTFVTGGADGTLRLWHSRSANEQIELVGIGEGRGLGLDPAGRLLTGDDDAVMRSVDPQSGAVVYSQPHKHWVNAVLGVPEYDLVVSAFGSVLMFWAAADGAERGSLTMPGKFDLVTRLVRGDGAGHRLIAVGSRSGNLGIVDLDARTVLVTHSPHEGQITSLVFDGARDRFLSVGLDGRLMATDAAAPAAPPQQLLRSPMRFRALAIVGDRLYTGEESQADGPGIVAERDPATGELRRSAPVGDAVVAIASIDGNRLAMGTAQGSVAVWDAAMLVPIFEQRLFGKGVRNVVAGPGGDWIAAIGYGGAPRILRADAAAAGVAEARRGRQRIADLRELAAEAMARTAWRPAAERRLRADPGLGAADREAAAALLPPINPWSLATSCYEEFAAMVGGGQLDEVWRERYGWLREAIASGPIAHETYCRCALALGGVRLGEPRSALDALAGVVLPEKGPVDGDGWFRPAVHFARGMAHWQLGDRAAAERERDALRALVEGAFAADDRTMRFLRELDDALRPR